LPARPVFLAVMFQLTPFLQPNFVFLNSFKLLTPLRYMDQQLIQAASYFTLILLVRRNS
jgi:hypothetical protein